jgi:hypothetical protein
VPFPVHWLAVSADNRFVALKVDEQKRKLNSVPDWKSLSVYMLDLQTGEHRRIGDGTTVLEPSPVGHIFTADNESDSVTLIDGLSVMKPLKTGRRAGAWWNGPNSILFQSAWPKNTEGFTEVGILNVTTGAVRHVKLREPTEALGTCATSRHFFTEGSDSDAKMLDEHDPDGNYVGQRKDGLAEFSASCKYVLPLVAVNGYGGPDSWSVHDVTGKLLIDFPWSEDEKATERWFDKWNPRYDHLLLMHSTPPIDKDGTVEVLDVRINKIIRQWSDAPSETRKVWSGDGKAVVTVRDHHVVFDKVVE